MKKKKQKPASDKREFGRFVNEAVLTALYEAQYAISEFSNGCKLVSVQEAIEIMEAIKTCESREGKHK